MKLSDIARLTIKKDSTVYNTMLGCDLIGRLQQNEFKKEATYKTNRSINKKSKGKR